MPVEIERKFLVPSLPFDVTAAAIHANSAIYQGYINSKSNAVVRIRAEYHSNPEFNTFTYIGWITIKGKAKNKKIARAEYEYEIPYDHAMEMLGTMCKKTVNKRRWFITHEDHEWHVDEFLGKNLGLITAEVELSSEEEVFLKPNWVGIEVTSDRRYSNTNLAKNPWTTWNTNSST